MPHYFEEPFNIYYLGDYHKDYDFSVHINLKFDVIFWYKSELLKNCYIFRMPLSLLITSNFSNIRPPKGGPHIAVTPLTIPSKPKNQEELSKVFKWKGSISILYLKALYKQNKNSILGQLFS